MPSSTTGSSTSASVVVCGPKPVASASSASAMIAADSTVRNTVARLIASFQISDLVPSRLQCSVAAIAAAYGPNGWSLARSAATGAASPCGGSCALVGDRAVPLLSVGSIADLLQLAADGRRRADRVRAGCRNVGRGAELEVDSSALPGRDTFRVCVGAGSAAWNAGRGRSAAGGCAAARRDRVYRQG